jgi:hypothetical protein
MIRKKKLKVPIYKKQTLELYEFETHKEILKLFKLGKKIGGGNTFQIIDGKHPKWAIAINKDSKRPDIFAHEAFHAACNILDKAGVGLDYDNQEPHAYLIQWIVGECHKFYKVKG